MKIVLLTSDQAYLDAASEARKMLDFYEGLAEETHVIVLSPQGVGLLRAQVAPTVWLHATNSTRRVHRPLDAVRTGLSVGAYDLVVALDPFLAGLSGVWLARKGKVPLCVHLSDDYFSAAFLKISFVNRLRAYLARYVLTKAATVRTAREEIGTKLRKLQLTRGKQLVMISEFLDMTTSAILGSIDVAQRLPDARFLVLVPVTPAHSAHDIAEAFDTLSRFKLLYPRSGSVVVGPEALRTRIMRTARQYTSERDFIFIPSIEHPLLAYTGIGAALCIGSFENETMVIEDIVQAGIPIVTTPNALVGTTLTDHVSCILCPMNQVQCLVDGLRELIEDNALRTRLAITAKAAVPARARQTRDEYIASLKHMYENCAGRILE